MTGTNQLDSRGLPTHYRLKEGWEVTPREVKAMRDRRERFLLLDCRTRGECGIAQIQGSVLIPIQEVGSRMEELEEHQDKKIVVYCHHGARSMRMTSILRQRGFKDVKSMAGGIDLWAVDVEQGMKRY